MTDLRKLAERICDVLGIQRSWADKIAPVLSKHRERLAMEIGCIMQDLDDGGITHDDARHMIARVLDEGGEQAAASGVAADTDVTSPATPDPHKRVSCWECLKTTGPGEGVAQSEPGSLYCKTHAYLAPRRPYKPDDPIYEVNDEVEEHEGGDSGVVDAGDESGDESVAVTVGPGDEVRYFDTSAVVVGASPALADHLVIESRSGVNYEASTLHMRNLRTPDGRPVSGFAEHDYGQLIDDCFWRDQRIAELERERDEAREATPEWKQWALEMAKARARLKKKRGGA